MMSYRHLFGLGFIAIMGSETSVISAESLPKGMDNVEKLAGCFNVTYRFVEDGVHDLFSKKYALDKPHKEWIGFKRGEKDTFILQHATFHDDQATSHFHEVWKYHPGEETWTQEVWSQAYGNERRALRYQCTAPWEMNRWECHAGKAQKPFRDNGAPFGFNRTDYERLDRENTLLVTPKGWIQNEHNSKRSESGKIVSYELGWITYRRLEDAACKTAFDLFPRESGDK
jgi:hypothetical protein